MPSEISEALTALGANALVQKVIDPKLFEAVRRYSPVMGAIPTVPWTSTQYFFNTRNALPAGGFVSDGGARPVSNSNYTQSSFTIRLLQAVGSVTGFAQQVTRAQIGDLLRTEIMGATRGLTYDIETGLMWGNAAATAGTFPAFDGFDTQISTFSGGSQNAIDCAGAALTLGFLDQLIDLVESNASEAIMGDEWMFVLSPRARSTYTQALNAQQRFVEGKVEIAPGVQVDTYRGVPLVPSSFLSARSVSVGTITSTPSTTGGTLAAGTVSYRISAVMGRYGELNAAPSVGATTTGSTGSVALSFTAPTAIQGGLIQTYRVYKGATAGTETLLGVVDAVVGFMADGITPIMTTTITDTGTALVPSNSSTVPNVSPTVYFGTNTGILPRVTASSGNGGGEDLYLTSRIEDNVCRPYVRDIQPIPLAATTTSPDVLPFALVSDTTLAIRAPQFAGRLRNFLATLTNTNPVQNTHSV